MDVSRWALSESRRSIALTVLASAAWLAGCGGERFPVAPVSGTVTLDGQPLAGARVGFEPRRTDESINAGPGSYATTDAEGRYRLETLDGRRGAVVATHDVTLSTFQGRVNDAYEVITVVEEKVPESQRQHTFEVLPEGTDTADFALTSAPEGGR
jgi:hypothetical protein